jgi:hypothetical protein
VSRGYRLGGRRRLGRIFQQLRPAAYIAGWFLDAEGGAGADRCRRALPFNDGVAGVSCPVAVLCVVAGFHVDTKIFKRGLILTRTG